MNSEQFAYWLQGFTELNPSMAQPTPEQWQSIVDHLKTVFIKVTPTIKPAQVDTIEDAMRRHHEQQQQRQISPYPPNIPYFGAAPRIIC